MVDQESDDETRGIGPGSRGTSARLGNSKKNNNNPALLKTPSQQKKVKKATKKEVKAANQAEAAWKSLYPDLPSAWKLPVNVTFKPLSTHDYGPMQVAHDKFNAWTNSPTEIYVIPVPRWATSPRKKRNAYWRAILCHEAWHLKQFAEASGPPKTYTKMMMYEVEAYCGSYRWIRDTKHPKQYSPQIMDSVMGQYESTCQEYRERLKREQYRRNDGLRIHDYKQDVFKKTEISFRSFLNLPQHTCLEQLYGQPC